MRKIQLSAAAAALALVGSLAAADAAQAQAQPFKPVQAEQTWTLDVGGGAIYGFSPWGGSSDKISFIPYGDFSWKDRLYGNPLDGLGYNVVKQDRLRAGVQIRPHYSGASGDNDVLDRPGLGADAAVYAYYRIAGNISLGGRLIHDVSGQTDSTGYFLSATQQSVTPVGLLQTTLYARGSDGRGARAYYGLTPTEAVASGYAAYRPDAGFQNAGLAALMMTPLGDKWAIGTLFNAERAVGDAADSPLTQAAKHKEMTYRAALLIVRRFGG
jgi:outer membrane protein